MALPFDRSDVRIALFSAVMHALMVTALLVWALGLRWQLVALGAYLGLEYFAYNRREARLVRVVMAAEKRAHPLRFVVDVDMTGAKAKLRALCDDLGRAGAARV